jgi:polyphosphate kinase 2 (PPK2 family)
LNLSGIGRWDFYTLSQHGNLRYLLGRVFTIFMPKERLRLNELDQSKSLTQEEYKSQIKQYQLELLSMQLELHEKKIPVVFVLEGPDAAGKGGAIKRVVERLDPRLIHVYPINKPTTEEFARHYMWRFWSKMPPRGEIAILDRSWYGRVLVERVEGFAARAEWQRAYDEINDFESQLVERGYYVAKFWLHISPEEQLARFNAREETAYKSHKITEEDYRNRERWDDYVKAVDQTILRTTSDSAPWHVIPANDKRLARVTALKAVNEGLARVLRQA